MTWRDPWIEVIRPYATTGLGLAEALKGAGAPSDLLEFVRCGLLDFDDIYTHQRDALQSVLAGRNVGVTAGTGSGKTEAFLLPILAAMLAESATWTGTSPTGPPWSRACRHVEGRLAGLLKYRRQHLGRMSRSQH